LGHSRHRGVTLVVGLLVLLAASFPIVASEERFYVQFIAKIMILAIFAMSLDLLVGYTGLISLGHAMFFGLGGYSLMLLSSNYGDVSLALSLGAALLVCAVAGLFVGLLVLRTSGIYFIMVTLAFAQMLYYFVHDSEHLGGSDGKYIYTRPVLSIFGWQPFTLDNLVNFYYLVLAMAIGAYVLLRVIVASPFGHVLIGIRANEHRMRSLGYATFRYKLVCFVIAGALGGLSGYLAAALDGLVNPELFSWHQSGQALMMVILGGMGTLVGPVLGAAALKLLELVFQTWTSHWQLFLGSFIILAVLVFPNGLASLFWRPSGNA
jgi:branched-chain amino acid transport system permease protein